MCKRASVDLRRASCAAITSAAPGTLGTSRKPELNKADILCRYKCLKRY